MEWKPKSVRAKPVKTQDSRGHSHPPERQLDWQQAMGPSLLTAVREKNLGWTEGGQGGGQEGKLGLPCRVLHSTSQLPIACGYRSVIEKLVGTGKTCFLKHRGYSPQSSHGI